MNDQPNTLGILFFTPTHKGTDVPIADEWLIKVDTLNETLEWRDHWIVKVMDPDLKQQAEEQANEHWPKCKWLRLYQAKGDPSSTPVWATCEKNATEIFQRMNINCDTLEIVK